MRPASIAITGADGFVGRTLADSLRNAGYNVIPFHRGLEAKWDGRECWADITRNDHMTGLANQGFRAEVIIHLAGLVDIALAPDSIRPTTDCRPNQAKIAALYDANVMGTAHVVDLAHACGARRIIFASSQTVYGYGENGYADENTALRPLEHYATSKVCAERILETAARQELEITVLRFPGIFAPTRPNGAVHSMCRSACEHGVIRLSSNCAIPFDVLALDDLVSAFKSTLLHRGNGFEIFNISTGETCSLEILAEHIRELVPDTRIELSGVPQPRFRMAASRAADVLQWRSASLHQRLSEMLPLFAK